MADLSWKRAETASSYELVTVTYHCDENGRRRSRLESRGRWARRPGSVGDVFEWLGFKTSDEVALDAEPGPFRDVPAAKGLTYEIDFEADFAKLPVDVSGIEQSADTYAFYVSTLDAHMQFDLLRSRRYGLINKLTEPGTIVRRPTSEREIEDWDPISVSLSDSHNESYTEYLGTGVVGGVAVHTLRYRTDNVFMTATFNMGDEQATMEGATRYNGLIHVDASDRSLAGGDLYEIASVGPQVVTREITLARTS